MECPSCRELLEVTGYIRLLGLKHTLLGPLFRHTQVCHPEQNMALFLALCLYKKKEHCFPVTLQLCVSCCERGKHSCHPQRRDGNSLGNSLGRTLKSGGRQVGRSLLGSRQLLWPPGTPPTASATLLLFSCQGLWKGEAHVSGKIPDAPQRKTALLALHAARLGECLAGRR